MARVLNYAKTKGVHSNAVYIGRSMKGIVGNEKFHNPFKMYSESQRDNVVKCIVNIYGSKSNWVL